MKYFLGKIGLTHKISYLILIVKFCPARKECRVEKLFCQGRMGINQTHASPKSVGR
jgi:hypothetical protein